MSPLIGGRLPSLVAILAALHPRTTLLPNPPVIRAITCVDGNVTLPQAVANAKTLVELSRRRWAEIGGTELRTDVANPLPKVYGGCDRPILAGMHSDERWEGHGKDGLGNISYRPESSHDAVSEEAAHHGFQELVETAQQNISVEKEHASVAMARIAAERPGTLTVVATGPLT
ncbi:hypothetical protein HDU93_002651, partial [Gonapodya sp. JEL0774]